MIDKNNNNADTVIAALIMHPSYRLYFCCVSGKNRFCENFAIRLQLKYQSSSTIVVQRLLRSSLMDQDAIALGHRHKQKGCNFISA